MNKLVILSAGHSPTIEGAVYGLLGESQESIGIVELCAKILKEQGVNYRIVPHELDLVDAIKWINDRYKNLGDALAIDVHKNAGGGTGIETFYFTGNQTSKEIAEKINKAVVLETGLKDRGAKPDNQAKAGRLGFVRDTNTWAVLIECGFIDNPNDNKISREKYALGLAKGILKVFGAEYKETINIPIELTKEEIKKEIIKLLEKL